MDVFLDEWKGYWRNGSDLEEMDELLEKCISYWKNGFILGSMDQFVNMNQFLEKQIHS